jgi:hypothetical protein
MKKFNKSLKYDVLISIALHISIVFIAFIFHIVSNINKIPEDSIVVEIMEDSQLLEDKSLGEDRLKKIEEKQLDNTVKEIPLQPIVQENQKINEKGSKQEIEKNEIETISILKKKSQSKKLKKEIKENEIEQNNSSEKIKNIVILAKKRTKKDFKNNDKETKNNRDIKLVSGQHIETVKNKDKIGNSGLVESGVAKDYVQDMNITKILSSVRRCWNKYYSYSESTKDLVVTLAAKLDRSGALISYDEKSGDNLVGIDQVLAYNYMLEIAVDSLKECTPIEGLDYSKYYMWSDVIINFKYEDGGVILR